MDSSIAQLFWTISHQYRRKNIEKMRNSHILSHFLSLYLEYFSFFQYFFFNIGVKWFKIIGQYFNSTFLSSRDGIMNNEWHLTVKFQYKWKNWKISNRFWKIFFLQLACSKPASLMVIAKDETIPMIAEKLKKSPKISKLFSKTWKSHFWQNH